MEIASQALDSTSAVTHRILLPTTQLGESLLASFGAEDGVIAEAMVTRALESNLSIDSTLEEVGPVLIDKGDDGTEAGTRGAGTPWRRSRRRATFSSKVACSPAKRAE